MDILRILVTRHGRYYRARVIQEGAEGTVYGQQCVFKRLGYKVYSDVPDASINSLRSARFMVENYYRLVGVKKIVWTDKEVELV